MTEPLFLCRFFPEEIYPLLILSGVGTARSKGSESAAEKRLQPYDEIIFSARPTGAVWTAILIKADSFMNTFKRYL
jgi:hypothetical protein